MTDPDFPYQKDDKITLWGRDDSIQPVTVLHVGNTEFFCRLPDGREHALAKYPSPMPHSTLPRRWERYIEPPVRKRWIVETEDRPPKLGDTIVRDDLDPADIHVVRELWGQPSDYRVVVSVEPADER